MSTCKIATKNGCRYTYALYMVRKHSHAQH